METMAAPLWKDLRLLLKCPSAEYVEALIAEIATEGVSRNAFAARHGKALNLQPPKIERLFAVLSLFVKDAMRECVSDPSSCSDKIRSLLMVNVPNLDARLVDLISEVCMQM